MADAGLLTWKNKLTVAEIQENLQTVLGAKADASATIVSLGLSGAIEGQEHQTVQLTTKKLQDLAATHALTEAQAQEFAMRTGVMLSMQTQASSVLPTWIATLKACTLAVWDQVKATAVWLATTPAGWATAAVVGITALAAIIWSIHDAITVTLEEQKEKLNEAKESWEEVKNELQELETELQNNINRIQELEALSNPSWVEKEELDRLREVTRELELQKQLKQDEQLKAAENLYKENKATIDKEFGNDTVDSSFVKERKQELSSGNIRAIDLENNTNDLLAYFEYLKEEKSKLTDPEQIEEYDKALDDLNTEIQQKMSSVSQYKQNILEVASIRELTDDEQATYDYLTSMQKMIYEFYSPATWNGLEFNSIFDTEGLEKTKEELIALAKAGELSPEALQSFPKLSAAIKDSELIVGEGSDAFEEFYNELMSLADKQDLTSFSDDKQLLLSASETIDQLNTRLKPSMDSIKSAWQNIFSDDGDFKLDSIDILSTCDSIKSKLDDMSKLGLDVDYSAYEDFARVLSDSESEPEDIKTAFESLTSSITQAALTGTEDFNTMKAVLENLGVDNSELVAFDALIGNPDALKEAGLDLATATDDQIATFANKIIVSSENAAQAIDMLRFHKEQCNLQEVNTADEVANLMTLAQNAGYTGEMIEYLTELEGIYQDVTENYDDFSADRIADKLARAEELKSLIADSSKKVEYNPDKVSGKNAKSASAAAKEVQKEVDIMSELNSEMNKLQSAYKTLCDIRDTYNEQGRITVDQYTELTDMGFGFLANLIDENGQLGLNTNAFEKLSNAKLQEMQIQLARNAVDTINGIKNETEAMEYLTYANENLRDAALDSTEALLYQAQAMAHLRGEQQGLAADQIVQGYEASKKLISKVEFDFDASKTEKETCAHFLQSVIMQSIYSNADTLSLVSAYGVYTLHNSDYKSQSFANALYTIIIK